MTTPATRTRRDFRQHIEVETPEHVVLDLEIAGVGSRLLAAVIDTALIGGLTLVVALLVMVLAEIGLVPTGPWIGVLMLAGTFLLWNGYYVFFEGLRQGRTPGKSRVGIRVVRDTGHPLTVADAVTRNLLRLADFLPPPYLGGLLLMALHPSGKRLGDLAAGTVVVRDQPMDAPPVPSGSAGASPAPPRRPRSSRSTSSRCWPSSSGGPPSSSRGPRPPRHVARRPFRRAFSRLERARPRSSRSSTRAKPSAAGGRWPAPTGRAPASRHGRRRAGPSSAASPSAPRGTGSTASGPTSSPISPPVTARPPPTWPGPAPTGRTAPRSSSSSGSWPRDTTRSTATNDRAGAPSGAPSR